MNTIRLKKSLSSKKSKKLLQRFIAVLKRIGKRLFYFFTLSFLDKKIEKKLKKKLDAKKPKHIAEALSELKDTHPEIDTEMFEEIRLKFMSEANRVTEIADSSLLRAGIRRAKWMLLGSFIVTAGLIGITVAVTHGSAIILLPLVSPLVTWLLTVVTIPINYDERMIGGLNSKLIEYYEEIAKNHQENTRDLIQTESFTESSSYIAQYISLEDSNGPSYSDISNNDLIEKSHYSHQSTMHQESKLKKSPQKRHYGSFLFLAHPSSLSDSSDLLKPTTQKSYRAC